MRANPAKQVALRAATWEQCRDPARADLTSAPGGITLSREEGELDAVFTCLGKSVICCYMCLTRVLIEQSGGTTSC
jgi:hypothetical protein